MNDNNCDIMPIVQHIRPGDCFHIYHRKDNAWTATISTYRYAKKTIIIKGTGTSPQEAILSLHAELIRKASAAGVTFSPPRNLIHPVTT